MLFGLSPLLIIAIVLIASSIKIINEYERGVVFTLGRFTGARGPGINFVFPVIQQLVVISLRDVVSEVPPQDVITRDNVSLKVNAVLRYRVIDPAKAVLEVENYIYAIGQESQTTLRSVLGKSELDDLLSNREKINLDLQQMIDRQTERWGVKVSSVEVKNVDLPPEMQRAMARQAEAERERRAKIIHAEGELAASQKLAEAAIVMSRDPAAIQLRYLQTLTEIASENNSTTIFPVPIDVLSSFLKRLGS